MGALATVLSEGGTKFKPSFIVDFENAQPSDTEKDLYESCDIAIQRNAEHLDSLRNYKGCTDLVKMAIQSPTDENKVLCWRALVPNVVILDGFFNHSKHIGQIFNLLLDSLCSGDTEAFHCQQSLVKQLAHVIDFAMIFDDLKMNCPAIPNDFSYFRRTMSGMMRGGKGGGSMDGVSAPVNDEVANSLSLFYANPTPMLNVLKTCIQLKSNEPMKTNIILGLSLMANICFHIVEFRQFNDTGVLLYCLRAAVGTTILADSLYEPGIFHPKAKKAPILARHIIVVVKNFPDAPVTSLINALRYNTKGADPKYFE